MANVALEERQILERHLEQASVDGTELLAGIEGVAQLLGRGPQAMIGQGGQRPGVGRPVGQRLEHPPGADAQQVRDQARQLDVGLFQQRFQPVLELDPVARQLDLRARDRAPQPLFGRGHEAQGQLLGDQPPHQPFGVREVPLAPPSRAVRSRGRQVQSAGPRAGPGPRSGARRPVTFQGGPDGLPVLRCRFHDGFVDLMLAEPVGPPAQLGGRAAARAPLERVLPRRR